MSGRIEKDNIIELKIQEMINDKNTIINDYSKSFNNKTINTKKSYITHAINFCNFLTREFNFDLDELNSIKKLNYSHIIAYIDFIKCHMPDGTYVEKTDGTCAAEIYAIKHFCKYLKLCKYIDYNPCDDIEIPRDKKIHEVISLTPEEIQLIKYNILNGVGTSRAKATQEKWKNRDLCLVLLGITTGLRVSALSNIDLKDINFEEKTITTIEKGKIERSIFLSDKMMEILNNWITDRNRMLEENSVECNALFISAEKKRMAVTTIRVIINKYTKNLTKKITPHKLRSTAATNLYESTGDIYLVADLLGHANIQNTKRYAKVSDERKAIAAKELSKLI